MKLDIDEFRERYLGVLQERLEIDGFEIARDTLEELVSEIQSSGKALADELADPLCSVYSHGV